MAFIVLLIWTIVLLTMIALYIRALRLKVSKSELRKLIKFRMSLLLLLFPVWFVLLSSWDNWIESEVEPGWYYVFQIVTGLGVLAIYALIHMLFPVFIPGVTEYTEIKIRMIVHPSDEEGDDRPSEEDFVVST